MHFATDIMKDETCNCHFMGFSSQLAANNLLYIPSHTQDCTYHAICYTSCEALTGTRNSFNVPPGGIDPMTHHNMSCVPLLFVLIDFNSLSLDSDKQTIKANFEI